MEDDQEKDNEERDNEETSDTVVNNPYMNVEGIIAPKQSAPLDQRPVSQPAQPSFSDEDKSAAARAITGATPALMSFLFGASPLSAESAIQQGQQYYKESTPQKLTTTVNAQGVPVYTDIRNAVGQQALVKQLRPSGVGVKDVTYVENGKPIYGRTDISGNVTEIGTGRVLNKGIAAGTIMPAVQTQTPTQFTGLQGQPVIAGVNKFATPGQPMITGQTQLAPGIGQTMGNIPAEKVAQLDKVSSEFTKNTQPVREVNTNINNAINMLNSKDEMAQQSGLAYAQRALDNQRVASYQPGAILANPSEIKALLDRADSVIHGGDVPAEKSRQVKQILMQLQSANANAYESQRQATLQSFAGNDANLNQVGITKLPPLQTYSEPNIGGATNRPQYTPQQVQAMSRAQKIQLLKQQQGNQ